MDEFDVAPEKLVAEGLFREEQRTLLPQMPNILYRHAWRQRLDESRENTTAIRRAWLSWLKSRKIGNGRRRHSYLGHSEVAPERCRSDEMVEGDGRYRGEAPRTAAGDAHLLLV